MMKWKVKKQPIYKDGDTRTRRVFAWKKTRIGDQWVWLERYEVHERFYRAINGTSWWSETSKNVLEWYT